MPGKKLINIFKNDLMCLLLDGNDCEGSSSAGEGGFVVAMDGKEVVVVQLDGAAVAVWAVGAVHLEVEHAPRHGVDGPLPAGLNIIPLDHGATTDGVRLLKLIQCALQALSPHEADGGGGGEENEADWLHEDDEVEGRGLFYMRGSRCHRAWFSLASDMGSPQAHHS